jgi:hypothetical protein
MRKPSWQSCASRSPSCVPNEKGLNPSPTRPKAYSGPKEKAAQEKLAQQLRQVEAENLGLKGDLGFYQRLLPAAGNDLSVRALQASAQSPTQTRYQALLMQIGKNLPEFSGRYEVQLAGTLDGKPWTLVQPGGPKPLQVKQSLRLEGLMDHPETAVVKTLQIKVTDKQGAVRATQTAKL